MRFLFGLICVVSAWMSIMVSDAYARVHIPKSYDHYVVEVSTDSGKFYIEMYAHSPLAGQQFLRNVNNAYYDGLQIHHMVPGYVMQWGDRRTIGADNYEYPLRVTDKSYRSLQNMDVGFANLASGYPSDKQLVLFLRDAPEDRGLYSIFGRVKKGESVVRRLTKGDRIRQMRIVRYGQRR